MTRLLDIDAAPRHRGTTKALVPLSAHSCPACGFVLDTVGTGQLALFFHGGYGAVKKTTRRFCHGCGWSIVVVVEETNPRKTA